MHFKTRNFNLCLCVVKVFRSQDKNVKMSFILRYSARSRSDICMSLAPILILFLLLALSFASTFLQLFTILTQTRIFMDVYDV